MPNIDYNIFIPLGSLAVYEVQIYREERDFTIYTFHWHISHVFAGINFALQVDYYVKRRAQCI